jgi:hypothetical protein
MLTGTPHSPEYVCATPPRVREGKHTRVQGRLLHGSVLTSAIWILKLEEHQLTPKAAGRGSG